MQDSMNPPCRKSCASNWKIRVFGIIGRFIALGESEPPVASGGILRFASGVTEIDFSGYSFFVFWQKKAAVLGKSRYGSSLLLTYILLIAYARLRSDQCRVRRADVYGNIVRCPMHSVCAAVGFPVGDGRAIGNAVRQGIAGAILYDVGGS